MRAPDECTSLDEIRAAIDTIDQQVIEAIGRRLNYVKAASKFKTSESSVRVPERVAKMLEQRRAWAEGQGLNPDVIEQMYRDLVSYFIDEERNH